MIIEPYKTYVVICKGPDNQIYQWNLNTTPGRKAWKILHRDIQPNTIFYNHYILSIENVSTELTSDFMKHVIAPLEEPSTEDYAQKTKPISANEAMSATAELGFPVQFAYTTATYRCQFCNGVVVNDICSECMFDWDS